MKIIGTTSTGFIIEASSRDVFNLIGFYSFQWYFKNKMLLILIKKI